MNVTGRTIAVRFTVAGIHRWAHARGTRHYLAHPHRHLFAFEVAVPVDHDDRYIEFHDLLALAQDTFAGFEANGGNMLFGEASCEHLAHMVAERVLHLTSVPEVTVSVFEDDENGARLTFTREDLP